MEDVKLLRDQLVDNTIMINLANKAKAFILKRVKRGQYLEGSTGGEQYSTKPMPIPYGLFIKKFGKSLISKPGYEKSIYTKRKGEKTLITTASNAEFSVFRNKSGKTMVLIRGGYKRFRELSKKSTEPVNMHWTSRMMRNLGILDTKENQATLGFSSAEEEKKAYYQHIGAGKNRITRKFMGLTEEELQYIADLSLKLIIKKLEE
jgi:hypothetical protein